MIRALRLTGLLAMIAGVVMLLESIGLLGVAGTGAVVAGVLLLHEIERRTPKP